MKRIKQFILVGIFSLVTSIGSSSTTFAATTKDNLTPMEMKATEVAAKYGEIPKFDDDVYAVFYYQYDIKNPTYEELLGTKQYTKEEYLLRKSNYDMKPTKYGYAIRAIPIRLSTDTYKASSNSYDVYLFYEWLSGSSSQYKDILTFASDSNFNFDNKTSYMQALTPNGPDGEALSQMYTSSSSTDRYKDLQFGPSYIFNLLYSPSAPYKVYPYGYMYCKGTRTNANITQAKVALGYSHQTMNFSGNLSISYSGASISISPSKAFETVTTTLLLNF